MLIAAIAVLLSVHVVLPDALSADIEGTRQTCENEGEEVPAHLINIQDIHCFNCSCQNGYVECKKASNCPSIEGCYMKLPAHHSSCCKETCKGCLFEGKVHASGTEWRDPRDPCRLLRCEASVVTDSVLQCYTPCHEPVAPAPGHCCPTCLGCQINGQTMTDDRNVTIPEDPCLKCHCERGGRMTCVKRSCPVLQCPTDKRRPPAPGECCPRCVGQRPVMEPPGGVCMMSRSVHRPGDAWPVDKCTRCSCANSTSYCHRQTCPVLECAVEAQHTPHGQCCPKCLPVDLKRNATCTISGHTYNDGESWHLGPCKSCLCHQGQVRCAVQMCPPCPAGFKEEEHPGECCQRCVESDGVCAVFGDPHYRTFDGKFYSFQGSCKYQLATDCVGRNFSIRVTHDTRRTKTSSWTKTISIKMGELKVNLGQKMRVKVNGKRIEPPYQLSDKVYINKTEESVKVHTHLGVAVVWDGYSVAEVYVPTKYKGHMCGLCGDFNGNARNDFMTRRGRLVQDADKFGNSWRVGGRNACVRDTEETIPQCQQSAMHKRNFRKCEPLKAHPFGPCHRKVHFMTYFKACMVDMCECPTGRCYCESFTAYAHECQRLGVPLHKWRLGTGCIPGQAPRRRYQMAKPLLH